MKLHIHDIYIFIYIYIHSVYTFTYIHASISDHRVTLHYSLSPSSRDGNSGKRHRLHSHYHTLKGSIKVVE